MAVYFLGCDMGGWHTKKGDALAVCKWSEGCLEPVGEDLQPGSFFYPCAEGGPVVRVLRQALAEDSQIVIGIDGALAWPTAFADLVLAAPRAEVSAQFQCADGCLSNPILYRETERFIGKRVLKPGDRPLSAVGDKFGNNSSKTQALVSWFSTRLPEMYRPPFDKWDTNTARAAKYSLIEVYPKASMKCRRFADLAWPGGSLTMSQHGKSDRDDAKRAAMTAVCYAAAVGIIPGATEYPAMLTPDDGIRAGACEEHLVTKEGWIFCPCDRE